MKGPMMGRPVVIGHVGVTLRTSNPKPIYRPREYHATRRGAVCAETWRMYHRTCGGRWSTLRGPHDSAVLHNERYCEYSKQRPTYNSEE